MGYRILAEVRIGFATHHVPDRMIFNSLTSRVAVEIAQTIFDILHLLAVFTSLCCLIDG